MIQKHIFRRLTLGFYVLLFSALLLGLTRYSYRAKELLVCWLFFSSLFVVLALMFLGIVLACYAGQHLVHWVRVAKRVIPELAVCLVETPQEAILEPRILVAGTIKLSAGSYALVEAIDPASFLRIEIAPSAQDDVPN
jgi:hypothetical protein